LETTLKSIFENMSEEEKSECLVIIFVAEFDLEYVASVADKVTALSLLIRKKVLIIIQ